MKKLRIILHLAQNIKFLLENVYTQLMGLVLALGA